MSIFKRIFDRARHTEPELGTSLQRVEPKPEPEPSPNAPVPPAQPAATAGAGSRPEPDGPPAPAPTPAAPQAEIPLKSLNRYRQDPGFQNFMDKARRPPGAKPRRRDVRREQ
jgi:hypothetical protein